MIGVSVVMLVSLVACGGGGSNSAPTNAMATYQGRWVNTHRLPGHTVLVVPDDDKSGATVWALAHDFSLLVKAHIEDDGQTVTEAHGVSFNPTAPGSTPNTLEAATAALDSTDTAKTLTLTRMLDVEPITLNRSSPLDGRLDPTVGNGAWQANFQTLQLNWAVADGLFTGTSTTGCIYSGSMTSPAQTAVYRVVFDEVCGIAIRSFAGIATVNPERTNLTVIATTIDDRAATALIFNKKP